MEDQRVVEEVYSSDGDTDEKNAAAYNAAAVEDASSEAAVLSPLVSEEVGEAHSDFVEVDISPADSDNVV